MLNFGAVIEQLPSRPKTTKRCVTIKGPNLCAHASHRFENKKDNITMTTKSSQTFLCNHCAFFRFLSNYGHINLLWVSTIPLFFKTNLQLWAFWPFKNAANIPCRQTGAKHRHTTLLIARCQQLQGVLERGMLPFSEQTFTLPDIFESNDKTLPWCSSIDCNQYIAHSNIIYPNLPDRYNTQRTCLTTNPEFSKPTPPPQKKTSL